MQAAADLSYESAVKNRKITQTHKFTGYEVTLSTPTARPKTNKQHRLNKQMGCSAALEVNVDQWVTKQHVYPKITYLQNTEIPQKPL